MEPTTKLPAKRMRFVSVPVRDERHDPSGEVGHADKAAMGDDPALEYGEPDLDLVDPRGVDRRVHETKTTTVAFVELEPSIIATIVMSVEVVPDDVDLALWGESPGQLVHERNQVGRGSLLAAAAKESARTDVEGAQEAGGAVTNVFKLLASRASRLSKHELVFALESLDGGLFVHADDGRSFGWLEI